MSNYGSLLSYTLIYHVGVKIEGGLKIENAFFSVTFTEIDWNVIL